MLLGRKFSFALLGLLLTTVSLHAQRPTGIVMGRVTDGATQQPLAGVTVIIAERGALTNADGRFTVGGVPAGTQQARAILLGYKEESKSVTVNEGATATVDFALSAQAVQLAQLVVVGYGTQRAGNVTGAVKQVTAAEFNTGRVISPEQLIESKVAGVQVIDNNEPGGGMSLRIRGATSINASSDPLYVIDGVPVGSGAGGGLSAGRNPLNFLNNNEIESITVLKDASAAAIYGANAANGVVLITTKKGSRKVGLEYTGTMSGSTITRKPDMLNATEFKAAVQQHALSNYPQLLGANTNWYDLVTRDAMGQEHNLAFSSFGETMNYRFSVGYLNQDGVIDGTNVQRLSGTFNYDQRMFDDHLLVRSSIKGARTKDLFTPGGVLSNAAQMGPTQPTYDSTSSTGYYNWPGNNLTSPDNPLEILNLSSDQGITYRSLGNVQGEYRFPFLEALKANINLGYDVTKATREQFTPAVLHAEKKTARLGNQYRRDDTFTSGLVETYLNYAAPLQYLPGSIDITGGYSYNQTHGDYPWWTAQGLSTDLLGPSGIPSAKQIQQGLWVEDTKLISFFGRANYNLKDRYLLAASLRRDGSSRFGPDNAWGTFPSVSLAWRLSEEPFMKNMNLFDDLKLRGSWGKTGNQAFGNYQQYTTWTVGDAQSQVQFGNEFVTTVRPSASDPNIKWEETKSYDLGLDYGLMGGKLSGAIDVYRKNTNDLIFTVNIPAGTGLADRLTTNIGSMRNTGIEGSLSWKVLDGGKDGFSWTADFNAAHNKNELTEINPFARGSQQIPVGDVAGGVGTKIQILQAGSPINSFFVLKQKYDASGKPIEGQYVDLNNDGQINIDDRRVFHDPAPRVMLGHSSYMTYGKLDASFTLRAWLGNYTYNNVSSNLGTYEEVTRGSPYNLHASVLKTGFLHPQYFSDYYVEDASFLRMDNVTVGYSLNYRGQPMRLFATVQNAFTITGYSGVDPTAGLNGIDNNIYPRSRTFTGGLNVRF